MKLQVIKPVEVSNLPEYPIEPGARLDSHGHIQWEHRRWLSSDMRWNGDHECKSMWFDLVNTAHSETPVGTLPHDLRRLSRMVQPPVEADRFERLCAMDYGPLHGWAPCRVDDEIRLSHPVVTRVVLAALASRANNAARVEAASQKRKFARVREDVAQLSLEMAQDDRKVRWIVAHIDAAVQERGGTRRTNEDLHNAVSACVVETRKGRFPKLAKEAGR